MRDERKGKTDQVTPSLRAIWHAEEATRAALEIFERILPPSHPFIGLTLQDRAYALRKLKRSREAKPLEKRAQSILAGTDVKALGDSIVDIHSLASHARP